MDVTCHEPEAKPDVLVVLDHEHHHHSDHDQGGDDRAGLRSRRPPSAATSPVCEPMSTSRRAARARAYRSSDRAELGLGSHGEVAALDSLIPPRMPAELLDEAHVRTKVDIGALLLPSTDIALVEEGERSEHSDGLAYPPVPPLVADLLARRHHLSFVGLVLRNGACANSR